MNEPALSMVWTDKTQVVHRLRVQADRLRCFAANGPHGGHTESIGRHGELCKAKFLRAKFRYHKFVKPLFIFAAALGVAAVVSADEGMWTFDNPPVKQLQQKYHFTPTEAWLNHVRLSSVRLNDGGSGSFVSAHGLLLTNHHVARGQLQKNSTAEHDYIKDGFYAATPEEEMKSPDLEVNVLVSTENVTARVQAALKSGGTPEQQFAQRKTAIAALRGESTQNTGLRSDVVTLYQGGEYWLYRYKKYTDVRLVFAPEQQAAFYRRRSGQFHLPALRSGHGAVSGSTTTESRLKRRII